MTQEQVFSIIRQALLFFGGVAVTKGWVDTETMIAVVGAFVTIGASAWALYERRAKGLINSTAALSEVSQIITDRATAISTPSPKVVTANSAAAATIIADS